MPKITGTVTEGGAPRAGAYVRLIGPSGEFTAEEYTTDDGAFLFHVVDGSWVLEARAAGAPTTSTRVSVSEGDAAVSIDLTR